MPKGKYPRKCVRDRFNEKVKKMDSGCHEWQSTIHHDGYGRFWYRTGQIFAHRMSYLLNHGEIPNGLLVLHRCDNRKCVNPEHLYIGTAKKNTQDMFERNRAVGNTKYGEDQISEAKRLYGEGMSQQKIADLLGIHQTTISKFVRGTQERLKRKD